MRSTLSKLKLQNALSKRLRLRSPVFRLEKVGTYLCGSIISNTFRGKSSLQRQRMIHAALEKEFGSESDRLVGTLLAYTPDEWNIDLEAFHMTAEG